MAFLPQEELERMGFARLGEAVLLSEKASIYNAPRIAIGSQVRIDDFAVLSAGDGGISIGDHVHVAVGVLLVGAEAITLCDFCGLSSRVSVYSSNDDYSGLALTGPTVPSEYRAVTSKPVHIGRHVIVGSGSVILPGVTLDDGVAIGAMSLVNRSCPGFGIYAGNPLRRIKDRRRDLLALEQQLLKAR